MSIDDWTGKVHEGDAIEVINQMPEKSVDCVIFSPPYWGLRDFGEETKRVWGGDDDCSHSWSDFKRDGISGGKKSDKVSIKGKENFLIVEDQDQSFCRDCGAWRGQLGLEPSHQMYVEHMVEIGQAVRHVLKDSGTWWLNLGDTYGGKPGGYHDSEQYEGDAYGSHGNRPSLDIGDSLPEKCKGLIPHRVAISLIDEGWICRNDVVWRKKNAMPESVKDRLSKTFEFLFFFSKEKKYYFNLDAIREPPKTESSTKGPSKDNWVEDTGWNNNRSGDVVRHPIGKNPGDVIETTIANFPDSHFATFPPKLLEKPIKASCPPDGIVLDPFMGSGTTAVVAENLGREWIGIDLNPEYIEMTEDRLWEETTHFTKSIKEW